MLASKKLPDVLSSILSDNIEGCIIMTLEGSVIASKFVDQPSLTPTNFAAAVSSIWSSYSHTDTEISLQIIKLDKVIIGIVPSGKNYIVAAFGSKVTQGLLKGRIEALGQYFDRVFEQLRE